MKITKNIPVITLSCLLLSKFVYAGSDTPIVSFTDSVKDWLNQLMVADYAAYLAYLANLVG